MQIAEIMSADVKLVEPSTTLEAAARLMKREDVGALPVGENDRLVGMVTDRDIVVRGLADGKDPHKATVGEVMTKGVVYCFGDQDVEDAARLMAHNQIRRLPVLDRDKRLVGIVALGDIAVDIDEVETAGDILEEVSRRTGPRG